MQEEQLAVVEVADEEGAPPVDRLHLGALETGLKHLLAAVALGDLGAGDLGHLEALAHRLLLQLAPDGLELG